ncbi:cell division protein ZapE [Flocculibacter collagenilyticus]|uniref:cell division protein ZapE n=1 Tax=Flocculibacter collagenilyticus TaxID=2744479 RepID=UPI002D8030CC|nr:cell division protein ZapE [Flocculibacter collagenilyticus]
MTPLKKYQQDLLRDDFQYDAAQENAVKHLERLYQDFVARQSTEPKSSGLLAKVLNYFSTEPSTGTPLKGIYFWGGVGRGKTYLVDTFYDCLPTERKLRIHFHRFMHKVHDELKLLPNTANPLNIIADNFKKQFDIICFDEFFVSDITDAMLLGTLIEGLFQRGITLVATSNIVPDDLYRNGLQRSRFLPAIASIKQHTETVNVDSGIDYRLRTLEQAEIYHHPLDEQADLNLNTYFEQLAPELGSRDAQIEIEGRMLKTRYLADGVVMFEFTELCETARSQVDYMELSREFHTVLLANVKSMSAKNDDAARRFIALVDEFYERNVKLIISAEVALEALYTQGNLAFEFRRCVSRLQEMQSLEYLARPHIP